MPFHGQNVVAESVSQVTLTNSVEVGTRRIVAGDEYVYVYNASASSAQISTGYGVVLSAVSGYSVTVSSTTTTDFMIGICRHVTIPTAGYGWVLSRGFSSFNAGASDSFAVGNLIAIGVDGAFASKSSATGYTGPVVGKCMVAAASGLSSGTGIGYFSFL